MFGLRSHDIFLIGAPTDVGTGTQGTQEGPAALRRGGLIEALQSLGYSVHDGGDVSGPANPHDDERIAYRNLDQVTQWCQVVHDAVSEALQHDQMPVMLGGDHSLAVGSISAVARHCHAINKPLWVFWIDAHADFNTVDSSPSGNMHGMPLRLLCGHGPKALTHMSGHCPALQVEHVRQIGLRSVDPQEQVALDRCHLQVFTMRDIQAKGMDAVLEEALRGLPPNAHVHLSFDVDCLDPQDAPGVGTPAEGGPPCSDIERCLQRIAQTGLVGSVDVVELNPQRDVQNKTTSLVEDLLSHFFAEHALAQGQSRIDRLHRVDEVALTKALIERVRGENLPFDQIQQLALGHVERLRTHQHSVGMNRLMLEYSLSSEEGMALMCLAEALLRIPDVPTRDALIRDKLSHADWQSHVGHSPSFFVNAATWGFLLAGKLSQTPSEDQLHAATKSMWRKGGTTLVRRAVEMAVGLMGAQFVMAQTIEDALQKSKTHAEQGFLFSFDMLGEAALSDCQALAYFDSYQHAITCLGQGQVHGVEEANGISVKLSALHPRYCEAQRDRVHAELYPRLYALAMMAKQYNMGLNIDAEESERLMLSLELFQRLAFEPALQGWDGLGFVVQCYQTRALAVVQHLVQLAKLSRRRLMVRLVKGAYWDSEIKRCQQHGLSHFPVFTRKSHSDVSYLACAAELLHNADWIYPQFATHNAHTFASVFTLAKLRGVQRFEMQCLYGMGEALYREPMERSRSTPWPLRCRVYAPIGQHVSLLPYLVRRMLENGANSSFVSQIVDPDVSVDQLVRNPIEAAERETPLSAACKLPSALFGPSRLNSLGLDVHSRTQLQQWEISKKQCAERLYAPVSWAGPADVEKVIQQALEYGPTWQSSSKMQRANFLLRTANLLESERHQFLYALCTEAKKTLPNAVAEVREAVDFCRYYARQLMDCKGGLEQVGLAVCISPWNFPLAIFMGQVAAALACGYCVIAKPAEQTPRIADMAIDVLHRAYVPAYAVQCVHGDGQVGAQLVASPHVRAVLFTGSNEVAKHIQHSLLQHGPDHPPAVLIAETGGQNAMVVDSSAHLEQVVQDVLDSGFDSAGQRCSALRVLCVQEEIALPLMNHLIAAIHELQLGDPLDLATDIGPVIDAQAHRAIDDHIQAMRAQGCVVWQGGKRAETLPLNAMPPTLIEIQHLGQLTHEVFGPVVHVLVYKHGQLDGLLQQINQMGFALTFGIHSRIQSEIDRVTGCIRAGNVYVNRNMVGAVVGVQPFGGIGLSGTGPKAGGPLYLPHLMSSPDQNFARELELPGPTGERNLYRLLPRGMVWCTADKEEVLHFQLEACLLTGNIPLIQQDPMNPKHLWVECFHAGLAKSVCWVDVVDYAKVDAVLCEQQLNTIHAVSVLLAQHGQAIVPIVSARWGEEYPLRMLYREQVISINTAATGGNAALMAEH
jgi:RHH-type proline utilization regulon transcriptional repressor/proline dehydrogenase/delta 1-pyrroline-5-carboxylate dehydrogenase